MEALYIAAGFRSLVVPVDEEGYWNERLTALETEMDRAEHITTEPQLREALVTARLRGLLSYLPDHSSKWRIARRRDDLGRFAHLSLKRLDHAKASPFRVRRFPGC